MKEKELLLKELYRVEKYYNVCLQRYGNGQHDYVADIEKVKRSIHKLENSLKTDK